MYKNVQKITQCVFVNYIFKVFRRLHTKRRLRTPDSARLLAKCVSECSKRMGGLGHGSKHLTQFQLRLIGMHIKTPAINPDQNGLVAADNRTRANHRYKFRAIGASSTGLRYSFAVRTVSDWNKLPSVVVEQENPAAFKAQLARCAPVRMPW